MLDLFYYFVYNRIVLNLRDYIMKWIMNGCRITGYYYNVPYSGIVEDTRVAYGGDIQYRVKLDDLITVFGDMRSIILINKQADKENYKFVDIL